MKSRNDRLKALGQTTQPTVIAVGENYSRITDAYVCIDDFTYQFVHPLKAIDTCFKCIHELAANYDYDIESIILIQKHQNGIRQCSSGQ